MTEKHDVELSKLISTLLRHEALPPRELVHLLHDLSGISIAVAIKYLNRNLIAGPIADTFVIKRSCTRDRNLIAA